MKKKHKILCIGEILWDSLPGGLFLGGAPFNVACHLQMLGEDVFFASRIGDDELGNQIVRRLKQKNINPQWIQIDPEQKTGIVNVTLEQRYNPTYEIVAPVAWDFIVKSEQLMVLARNADALVFGSLAQRNPDSRQTIETLRRVCPYTVFDINLRPPYDTLEIVKISLQDAKLVKLNDHELLQLAEWFDFSTNLKEASIQLAQTFYCETVCVTKGADGAALWHRGNWCEHPGFKINVQDTVGSGDAFLAALISGILANNQKGDKILEFANAVGAWVATCEGATPALNFDEITSLLSQRVKK